MRYLFLFTMVMNVVAQESVKKTADLSTNTSLNAVFPAFQNEYAPMLGAVGAVGREHLVSIYPYAVDALNGFFKLAIMNKDGDLLDLDSLRTIIGMPASVRQPRLIFEPLSERFVFVCAVGPDPDRFTTLKLAVSHSADPTEGWYVTELDLGSGYDSVSEIRLGSNINWITVTASVFNTDVAIYAIDKSSVTTGGQPVFSRFVTLLGSPGIISLFSEAPRAIITPSISYDSDNDHFLVMPHDNRDGFINPVGQLRIMRITGTAAAPLFIEGSVFPESSPWDVDSSFFGNLDSIRSEGLDRETIWIDERFDDLDTDDIQSAVYRNGSLWAVQMVQSEQHLYQWKDRIIKWWEINPVSGITIQSGILKKASGILRQTFAPSIAVNSADEVMISYNSSGLGSFVQANVAFRDNTTPLGQMLYDTNVKQGDRAISHGLDIARWGMASATCVDPADDLSFWSLQRVPSTVGVLPTQTTSNVDGYWAKIGRPVTVSLNREFILISESAGLSRAFNIVLSDTSTEAITVAFSAVDGTAMYGSDFTVSVDGQEGATGTVVFQPSERYKTVIVQPLNDNELEDPFSTPEMAVFRLDSAARVSLGAQTETEIRIFDDDYVPRISFESSSSVISENNVDLSILLSMDDFRGRPYPISVTYWSPTVTATATYADDYTLWVDGVEGSSGTITFAPFEHTKVLHLISAQDTHFEGDESVHIQLGTHIPSSPNPWIFSEQRNFLCTIVDDEPLPTVTFTGLQTDVGEGEGSIQVEVILSSPIQTTATVHYGVVIGGTATSPADYTMTGGPQGTFTFEPGETSKMIEVQINNNALIDGTRWFPLVLSNPVNTNLGTNPAHFVVISDDEEPLSVYIDPAFPGFFDEGAGGVLIPFKASSGAHSGFQVNVSFMDGTATGGGVDYNTFGAGSATMNFSAGSTSSFVLINIIEDSPGVIENAESFTVLLTTAQPNITIVPEENLVFILDNDLPRRIQFVNASTTPVEGLADTIQVAVEVSVAAADTLTVDYTVADTTATRNQDYVMTEGTLIFEPSGSSLSGLVRQYIPIDIVDDTEYEGSETFTITLSNATGNAVVDGQTTHIVNIISDDDSPVPLVGFQQTVSTESEGDGTVQINIQLSRASTVETSVEVAVLGGSAEGGGVDFILAQTTVHFPAGTLVQSANLDLVSDQRFEGDESIELGLHSPTDLILGSQSTRNIIVEDDETDPFIEFPLTSGRNLESTSGTVLIGVQRFGISSLPASVDFAVSGGTADSGDFSLVPGTLHFTSAPQIKYISAVVSDDMFSEGNETFEITLSNATGSLGSDTVFTYIILDDDVAPTISIQGNMQVIERDRHFVVTMQLDFPTPQLASIDVAISGTAANGTDYEGSGGVVFFDPEVNPRSAGISIDVFNDNLVENDETIILTLSNPNGLFLDNNDQSIFTILNDDGEEVDLHVDKSVSVQDPCEGETITYTIDVTNLSILPATGISLVDDLPPGVIRTGTPVTATRGHFDDSTGMWHIPDLDGEHIASLDLEVRVIDGSGPITNITTQLTSGQIDTVPGNNSGSITIVPYEAIRITSHPIGTTVCVGQSTVFSVTAIGESPTYQWTKDGVPLAGQTDPDYFLNVALMGDSGFYRCDVTNLCGTVSSYPALFQVFDSIAVAIDPPGVAMGLGDLSLHAVIRCEAGPVDYLWTNLNTGETSVANPFIFSLSESAMIQVAVTDTANNATSTAQAFVLVSQNPDFLDFNNDSCNNLEDLYDVAQEWTQAYGGDPNGDGIIDIRDLLFLNLGNALPCP